MKKPPPPRPRSRRVVSADTALARLRAAAAGCRDCDLWRAATQVVFGEGPARAQVMLIGEQPGDAEDRSGRPFVGPAGRLLDRALIDAGIERSAVYLTNTVKHFKFTPRGKRRLHQRANAQEQVACRQWLDAEIEQLRPRIVVCLGAMASRAIFGAAFGLMKQRGQWIALGTERVGIATVHPSYLLRVPDEDRDRAYREFVVDLQKIQRRIDMP